MPRFHVSEKSFCPCKMEKLDNLFDGMTYSLPNFDYFGKEKKVILDIRILDHPKSGKNKNIELYPVCIHSNIKNVFSNDTRIKRFAFLEHDHSVVLALDDDITMFEFSEILDEYLVTCYPSMIPNTFLNYSK